MVRSILALALLLVPFPGNAADVPLSDRPLAPLLVTAFDAAAAPDAVLLAFISGPDIYAQRLTAAGDPIDETPIYLVTPDDTPTGVTVLWDGARWAVLWKNGIAWIDRDGNVDGPHETGWWHYQDVIADRIVVATKQNTTEQQAEFRLAELNDNGRAIPLGSILAPNVYSSSWWIVGLDRGPGILSHRLAPGENGFYNATATLTAPGGDSRNFFFEMKITGLAIGFLASRDGGGLLLWNRDGLRGMIIRPDMTATQPFAIGPAETISSRIVATSHDGGWDVLFRPGSVAHIARIERSGSVDAAPLGVNVSIGYWLQIVRTSASNLLFDLPPRGGVMVTRIAGTALEPSPVAAIGEAAQRSAHAAAGDGVELVVWEEQAPDGLVLKATRIVGGEPLDGAGLLVAAYGFWGFRDEDRFDVAFDGERFVVAWVEGPQVLARAITAQGAMSDPVRVAEQASIDGLTMAGAGQGRAAVVWSGSVESWLVPLRSGVPGPRVAVGPFPIIPRTSLPRLAASGDRYLAVFEEVFECRITCAPDGRVWARAFSLDGDPLTEPKRLSERTSFTPQVVTDGRDFFVMSRGYGNHTLARIGPQLEILDETTPVRFGELSIEGAELRIDAGSTRAVYSLWGHLIRLEPLPLFGRDALAARLAHERVLVRTAAHPDRLVIRPLADPAGGTADIAIVPTGRVGGPFGQFAQVAFFRIEHRGGVPVRRFDLWSDASIYVPDDPPAQGQYPSSVVLERPLSAGESFEVGLNVQVPAYSHPLHVAADAIDLVPANNVAKHGAEPRPRRRAVRREP